MVFLEKFEKFNRSLSSWFEWIGLFGLLVVMFITCIDVIGAKLFLRPIFGAIDIVVLSQLVAISFACAFALILGRHVRVEFFVARLVYGYSLQTGGEVSATARIPLYPFAYGIALASIPVCLVFLLEFLKSLTRIAKK
jgi:TRAP-type C4-dicarboxylate transport system permease small subunit